MVYSSIDLFGGNLIFDGHCIKTIKHRPIKRNPFPTMNLYTLLTLLIVEIQI